MDRHRRAAAFLGVCFLSFYGIAGTRINPCPLDTGQKDARLAEILNRCAVYCAKLSGAALDFVCRERIEETVAAITMSRPAGAAGKSGSFFFSGPKTVAGKKTRSRLVYDYQLVREKTGRIVETRTLLEDNGRKVLSKNAPLKTSVFEHKYIIMGPVGLLGRSEQAHFDFKIAGEATLSREPTIVLEAAPKPGDCGDRLYGKIWIRTSDTSILKIEWAPESLGNYEKIEEIGRDLGMKPRLTFASEYDFEKNGIRFPSRYSVEEAYTARLRAPLIRSTTEVVYDRYKFFTVETGIMY